jgi:hypothetical protein
MYYHIFLTIIYLWLQGLSFSRFLSLKFIHMVENPPPTSYLISRFVEEELLSHFNEQIPFETESGLSSTEVRGRLKLFLLEYIFLDVVLTVLMNLDEIHDSYLGSATFWKGVTSYWTNWH